MFKIIAIRPLKGCKESVLKCLKIDQFYYLCNDYVIKDKYIKYRNEYIKPLPEDFFSLEESNGLTINVSAIVGKNGDGKSSIVELMMRIINNCAKHYKITNKANFLRVEGVKAELYYQIDDIVYCIKETQIDKYPRIVRIANLKDTSNNEEPWIIEEKPVVNVNILKELFSTIVSNYSHYAYNTNDFKSEWSDKVKTDNNEQKCWLYHLLNNEDQMPLVVHPCREQGNIDVNRETQLSMQRLLALYIQESNTNDKKQSFREIGGNYAEFIKLTEVGYSEFQDLTIIKFFTENKSVSSLLSVNNRIKALLVKDDEIESETLYDGALQSIERGLDFLIGINEPEYHDFLFRIRGWLKGKRNVFSSKSDLKQITQLLHDYEYKYQTRLRYKEYYEKYNRFFRYNVRQLVRCRMIYEIIKTLEFNYLSLLKKYEELTDIERCQHYIVYKIIDIFSTNSYYRSFIYEHAPGWSNIELLDSFSSTAIRDAVGILLNDDSYLSLSIHQCMNYIEKMERDGNENIYMELSQRGTQFNQKEDNSLYVRLDDLKNRYNLKTIPLSLLPPPIYDVEVIYESPNKDLVPYSFLSSGEKQFLNIIGALIYQLRIIDSETSRQYENINLILEEIELYFHPEFQRRIINSLLKKIYSSEFQQIKRINILFVTHSPFLLSDIPLCNVLFLEGGKSSFDRIQENTFGANIHGLLRNSFFLPSLPIGEFAYDKINRIFERFNRFEFDDKDRDKFYSTIMRVGEPYLRAQLLKLFHDHFK